MKKILIIVPKLSNGGIEKIASNFSMNLSDDIEQHVYSIMPQDKAYPFKVNPISLDVNMSRNYIGKLYVFCRRVFLLRKLVKKYDIDTCISFGERCNIINIISGSASNKVITIHSLISVENNAKGILGKVGGFLSKVLYRKAEQIVCVSEAVAEDALNYLGLEENDLTVIYNGHDINNIRNLSKDINDIVDYKFKYIASVGRLTYAKGHWHLIRAFSIIKKRYPELKLVIVGEEEADQIKSTLDKVIRHFGLEDSVLFPGHLDNPYPIISNAEVLALSSIYEGLPGVVIESFACGTPVVASNNGGQKELLLQGNASNVPSGPLSSFVASDRGCIAGYFDGTILDVEDVTLDERQFADALMYVLDGNINKDSLVECSELYSLENMMRRYNSLM